MFSDIEKKVNSNKKFSFVIKSIIETDDFQSLKRINQHGTTRYLHCLKVSYYSYIIADKLKLDTRSVARAGLLHDFFFLTTKDSNRVKKKLDIFSLEHGNIAANNAQKIYRINRKERNIIKSHMFPFCKVLPRYPESIIVNLVDTFLATIEFVQKWKYQLSYIPNLIIIIAINKLFS